MTGGSPTEIIPKNDTWVSQKTSTSSGNEKGNSDGKSYFQFYKNKMRRIKEAGLKADRNILKSHLKNEKQTYGQYGNNFHEETINTNNPLYSEKAANGMYFSFNTFLFFFSNIFVYFCIYCTIGYNFMTIIHVNKNYPPLCGHHKFSS